MRMMSTDVSPEQLIGIISVLFLLLVALVGLLYRIISSRLDKLEAANNSAVLKTRIDEIAADIARLEGRFDQRQRDKDKFDYEWRHGEYVDTINAINLRLLPLPKAIEALEKWVEKLDRKVFNGHREPAR
jgi:hypothetical protein